MLSRVVLAAAYFISVTYYLQLLAAFLGNAVGITDSTLQHLGTTGLLLAIGGIGMWRGLSSLERLESYAIAVNLGTIAALIIGLVVHNAGMLSAGTWQLPSIDSGINWQDLRVLLGLLIVVQGFETSRYLGATHSPDERISTMKRAQLLSAVIYIIFIGLLTPMFTAHMGNDVTAIVQLTAPVALILPLLISIAAIGSQFSAAVADNAGAGGLIEDLSHHKVPMRYAYLLILLVTIGVTWDVNGIIAYASRAFALFYTTMRCCHYCHW